MPRECPEEAVNVHAAPHVELTLETALSAIFGVMLNIVVIMAAGYWLAENKGLSKDARAGLSIYIGWAALPALFFATLTAEDFLEAEGAVLLAVSLAKLSMIFFSLVAGWATQQFRTPEPGALEFRAGIYALLTTNGDEVGLGALPWRLICGASRLRARRFLPHVDDGADAARRRRRPAR